MFSELDREAQRRATSVYLVNGVIPMLPSVLCEDLCSLNPNVDRLAFSVVWKMTRDGSLAQDAPIWYKHFFDLTACCCLIHLFVKDVLIDSKSLSLSLVLSGCSLC